MPRRSHRRTWATLRFLAMLGVVLGVAGIIVQALSQVPPLLVVILVAGSVGAAVYFALTRGPRSVALSAEPASAAPVILVEPSARGSKAPPPPEAASGTWYPREVPTLRGERVANRAEARIADFLHRHGYDYQYEPHICGFRPDFHLPAHNLIIEHWSRNDEDYLERRDVKIRAYLTSGYNLIGLDRDDWPRLEQELRRRLYRFDKSVYRRIVR